MWNCFSWNAKICWFKNAIPQISPSQTYSDFCDLINGRLALSIRLNKRALSVHLGSAFCTSQMHVCVLASPFFFFFSSALMNSSKYCSCTVRRQILLFMYCSRTVHGTHNYLYSENIYIKNWSHDTIHTFKNYFCYSVFLFSVFSFQLYLNGP